MGRYAKSRTSLAVLFSAGAMLATTGTRAQSVADADELADESAEGDPADAGDDDATPDPELSYGASASVTPMDPGDELEGRAHSSATRPEMNERQSRSLPDALRYEPGLSVQQTAHGQASPYVRGMTGQQVVHLFDGIRLNNAIYRQGPNQYFFTVDSATVARVDVLRGGASTRYGEGALGGALLATPREPDLELAPPGWALHPGTRLRLASADRFAEGRLELEATHGSRFGALVGFGYRRAGLLRAGGAVDHLRQPPSCAGGPGSSAPRRGDCTPWVARFREERAHPDPRERGHWRTQLGTGFRAFTYDARIVRRLHRGLRWTTATYGFRELDAPRTDQCPPPEAPQTECLKIARQQRSLAYTSLRGPGAGAMRDVDLTLSYQRHLERRVRDRPLSRVRFDWRDRVDTLGITFHASSPQLSLGSAGHARVRYGAEAYRDGVSSRASQTLTDLDFSRRLSRGQYLNHSRYASVGAFTELKWVFTEAVTLRTGVRAGWVGASAPGDPESGTQSLTVSFPSFVGRAGLTLGEATGNRIHIDLDPGVRAPNLDDLTSRQQVGPGFQFENARLESERALTMQVGFQSAPGVFAFSAWAFATGLRHAIQRAPRDLADCPPETPECAASRTRFSLVNLPGRAWLLGGEVEARLSLPSGFSGRAGVNYAWGRGADPSGLAQHVPLSRVPPLSGNVELRYRHAPTGLYTGAAMRWAWRQTRLAPSDQEDARIPVGGTPGYAVLDLRAGAELSARLNVNLVIENLLDAAYRVHGSSVNGAGLGVLLGVDAAL